LEFLSISFFGPIDGSIRKILWESEVTTSFDQSFFDELDFTGVLNNEGTFT